MHHLAIETYLFQRTMVVCKFHKVYPCTYAGCYGYSRVYVGLKNISGPESG